MMTIQIHSDAYFVIDGNVGFMAKHMRQLGYHAESIIEINRSKKLKPKLHRDEQSHRIPSSYQQLSYKVFYQF
jgi:hypothetical protein